MDNVLVPSVEYREKLASYNLCNLTSLPALVEAMRQYVLSLPIEPSSEILADIEELNTNVSNLQASINSLNKDNTANKQSISNINSEIDNIKQSLATITSNISDLTSQYESLEDEYSSLLTTIDNFNTVKKTDNITVTVEGHNGVANAKRSGNFVNVYMDLSYATRNYLNSETVLFNLPEGFRPYADENNPVILSNGVNTCIAFLRIKSNGNVTWQYVSDPGNHSYWIVTNSNFIGG